MVINNAFHFKFQLKRPKKMEFSVFLYKNVEQYQEKAINYGVKQTVMSLNKAYLHFHIICNRITLPAAYSFRS